MLALLAGALKVCFNVHVTGCANATGSCCSTLSNSFHKLAFLTSNTCMKAFSNITYNGDKKSHDVSLGLGLGLPTLMLMTAGMEPM
jgi:hypothetical protein